MTSTTSEYKIPKTIFVNVNSHVTHLGYSSASPDSLSGDFFFTKSKTTNNTDGGLELGVTSYFGVNDFFRPIIWIDNHNLYNKHTSRENLSVQSRRKQPLEGLG